MRLRSNILHILLLTFIIPHFKNPIFITVIPLLKNTIEMILIILLYMVTLHLKTFIILIVIPLDSIMRTTLPLIILRLETTFHLFIIPMLLLQITLTLSKSIIIIPFVITVILLIVINLINITIYPKMNLQFNSSHITNFTPLMNILDILIKLRDQTTMHTLNQQRFLNMLCLQQIKILKNLFALSMSKVMNRWLTIQWNIVNILTLMTSGRKEIPMTTLSGFIQRQFHIKINE